MTEHRTSDPSDDIREFLGQLVRMEWVAWAREQPHPKATWLAPWHQLTEPEREVDRRIGERIYRFTKGLTVTSHGGTLAPSSKGDDHDQPERTP